VQYYNESSLISLQGNVPAKGKAGDRTAKSKADDQDRQPDGVLLPVQRGGRSLLLSMRRVPLHGRLYRTQLHEHPQANILQRPRAGAPVDHFTQIAVRGLSIVDYGQRPDLRYDRRRKEDPTRFRARRADVLLLLGRLQTKV
jgi:hypothetical protein